jgi:hypothetical protein
MIRGMNEEKSEIGKRVVRFSGVLLFLLRPVTIRLFLSLEMDQLLPLGDLGQTVRHIKKHVESISEIIGKGNELLEEASVQLDRGKDLLDQNQKLLGRIPRSLSIFEVTCICVGLASCIALIKYLLF